VLCVLSAGGVVLYTMLVGRYPFQSGTDGVGLGQEMMDMLRKMKNQVC
jgi:hypothetical protein